MIILRKEEYTYEPIPNGSYVAEVESFEEKENKKPEWGPLFRVKFKLLEEPFVGRKVSGLVPGTWKPGNKLDKWLTAMGVDAGASTGTAISQEQLAGAKVSVYLVTDPDSTYANVKEVNPIAQRDLSRIAPVVQSAPKVDLAKATASIAQQGPVTQTSVVSSLPATATGVVAQPQTTTVSSSPVVNPMPGVNRKRDIPF